jgi:hypothetical protein
MGDWTPPDSGIGYGRSGYSAGPFGGIKVTTPQRIGGVWQPAAVCNDGEWTDVRLAA